LSALRIEKMRQLAAVELIPADHRGRAVCFVIDESWSRPGENRVISIDGARGAIGGPVTPEKMLEIAAALIEAADPRTDVFEAWYRKLGGGK
jgi:hypothetical protein